MYIKSIQKKYKNHTKTLVYKRAIEISPPMCKSHSVTNCSLCRRSHSSPLPSPSSIARTKAQITDYILMNEFDLFCTFTFDPKKVDSMNIDFSKTVMIKWLNNIKKQCPGLLYILVPEKHKSGALHFHALIKNYVLPLEDSGKFVNKRRVFNIPNWSWGFSTAVKIDDIDKVANYVQKYITKDMINQKGKKRFWCSRGLRKPEKQYNVNIQEFTFPQKALNNGDIHDCEYYTIYRTVNWL